MLWFNSHRRFRAQLSAYIDAELPAKDALALDAHVQSCEACSAELGELRMAAAALRELPEVDVPRSFALSPADVARLAPPAPVRSLNSGLRVTGAGLAAALAVLLVLDVGGVVGGGDEGGRDESGGDFSSAAMQPQDENAFQGLDSDTAAENPAVESGSADAYFVTGSPSPVESSSREPGASAGTGSVAGGAGALSGEPTKTPMSAGIGGPPAGGESPAAPAETATAAAVDTPVDTPVEEHAPDAEQAPRLDPLRAVTPTPTSDPAKVAEGLGLNGGEEQDDGTLSILEANADSDDGPSALLVTEIVLAALLGASIVGVAAATYAERRRR